MNGLAQSECEHSTSSELQGPQVNLTYRWISQHTPTCKGLRAGACWALPSCVQGLPGLDPRGGEGGIFNAAFGVVFPLAGGRCVPRTGVRLDCPLWVALPASLPCLSLLPHSGATCSSSRTGALDWWETVEGAAGSRLSQKRNWKLSLFEKYKGRSKNGIILCGIIGIFCARVASRHPIQCNDDMHVVYASTMGVREGQGHKLGETCRQSQKNKGFLFIRKHCIERFWELAEYMLHFGEARHLGPRFLPLIGCPLSVLMSGAGFLMVISPWRVLLSSFQ